MCENDRDCIEKCLNSHPEAFRHLVTRYQSALVPFLVGKLGSIEQAEEAAQETFVRAYFDLAQAQKAGIVLPVAARHRDTGGQGTAHGPSKRRKDIARLWKENRPSPELSDSLRPRVGRRRIGSAVSPDSFAEVLRRPYVCMRLHKSSKCRWEQLQNIFRERIKCCASHCMRMRAAKVRRCSYEL